MIPLEKVKNIVDKHSKLETDLSSNSIDKKKFAEKTFLELNDNFDSLQDYSKSKVKYSFITVRKEALDIIIRLILYFKSAVCLILD